MHVFVFTKLSYFEVMHIYFVYLMWSTRLGSLLFILAKGNQPGYLEQRCPNFEWRPR